ncbi:MAG: hypothetical protein LBS36_02290 [Oscillospiraceae bacterium]|nr:hypothetical protein [Oscillospiraceae bacterium]
MKKVTLVFCAIVLIAGILFSASGCSIFQQEETTTTKPDKQVLVNSPEPLAAYYDELVAKAFSVRPAVSVERTYDVKDIDVMKRGAEERDDALDALKTALEQAKTLILTDVKKAKIDPSSTEYGQEISGIVHDIALRGLDGVEKIAFEESKEKDANTGEEKIIVNETKINIELKDLPYPAESGTKIARMYKTVDLQKILTEFVKVKDYITVGAAEEFTFAYDGCTITVEVDRKEDQVTSIVLTKNVTVVAPAEAVGPFEAYGALDVHLKFVDTIKFSFDWTDPNAEVTTTQAS